MALPSSDTVVTYPAGATSAEGVVVHVEPLADGRSAVMLDSTAAHPVDTAWPDQPADRAVLRTAAGTQPILDVVTAGISEGRLHLGADLPVRTGTEGWTFVVAHVIDGGAPEPGSVARVEVDVDYRDALSAGHTGCHLASLALDEALAERWTKPAPTDALGNPAFDALAIERSRIHENGSVDVYRLGKSLRRKGFPADGFADPAGIAERVNRRLAEWISAGGAVQIRVDDPRLSARRSWECDLPDARVSIPCGGTHLTDLAELSNASVSFEITDLGSATEVRMTTTVQRRHS
ncbi:alanyl-tRNA editing protein [Agromyces silvae]|uniref:metal-dependent hydrolase n=1 Tax=Agromyces silvae TaxID=3388266 RepID=UPI00280B6828|nr:metal-dependent hydrolase [Agromyces protaetiae]